MSDPLLPYYEQELAYIRQQGVRFAEEHPKVAGHIGFKKDSVDDPHAARLIESVAYLNARIHHKLDDEFSELSNAFLDLAFPHYLRPLPSMAIVQFVPDPEQIESVHTIPAGIQLETDPVLGDSCTFTSAYPVELLPVSLVDARYSGAPFTTPCAQNIQGARAVLQLQFESFNQTVSIGHAGITRIRLFLDDQPQFSHILYQLLLNQCLQMVLTREDRDLHPVIVGANGIKPVGFSDKEGLLPYPENSFPGYRLVTEYFAFPEKFLFIDLEFEADVLYSFDQRLNIHFYLNTFVPTLVPQVSRDSFALGCAPVVNLFSQQADPVRVDHTQLEYPVIVDSRRPRDFEVYAVEKVTAISGSGTAAECLPFYGTGYRDRSAESPAFWRLHRRSAKLGNLERDDGTDVFISISDRKFNPIEATGYTLMIRTIASNRDRPAGLDFGRGRLKLQCVDGSPPCSSIHALTQPTRCLRPPLDRSVQWNLITHLNLNSRSLTGQPDNAEALRELLGLYDFKNHSANRNIIEAITRVHSSPATAAVTVDGRLAFCRGMEVEVELDESRLIGSSAYLFASVLEHFFAACCPVNSFTRTLIKLKHKEGYLKKCPPRSGSKTLL